MVGSDGTDAFSAENRLERCVASVLRIIDAAQIERQAPPVRAARRRLGTVHGVTRLARARERTSAAS
jgi:hypothetical protein